MYFISGISASLRVSRLVSLVVHYIVCRFFLICFHNDSRIVSRNADPILSRIVYCIVYEPSYGAADFETSVSLSHAFRPPAQARFNTPPGTVLSPFWVPESIEKAIRFLIDFLNDFGTFLAPFWPHFGVTLESLWVYISVKKRIEFLSRFRERFWELRGASKLEKYGFT